MKHSKHIAWIIAFALLAVTMIGTLAGCKNAAGGDGSEDLTGYYVWKHHPNAEGEQVNYYAQFTKSTLQIYEVTEADGKVSLHEERLGKRLTRKMLPLGNYNRFRIRQRVAYLIFLQQVLISCMKTNLIPVVMMPTVLPYRVSLLGLKKIP